MISQKFVQGNIIAYGGLVDFIKKIIQDTSGRLHYRNDQTTTLMTL